ncbi:unnamed protein product [Caretta caretta]
MGELQQSTYRSKDTMDMLNVMDMNEEELQDVISDIEEDSDKSESADSRIEETAEDEKEEVALLMITHLILDPQGRPLVPIVQNDPGVTVGILCHIDTGSSMSILNLDISIDLGALP